MAVARARFIADLLEIHAQDLAFLWGERRDALNSARHTLREYAELNERIEAHVQGLLVAGPEALLEMLRPLLAAPDRDEAFAAAYALLRLAQPEPTRAVVAEFSRANGAALAGMRDALGFAPPALFAAQMRAAFEQAEPLTAVSAAAVLANHRLLDGRSPRLALWLQHDDPSVCALAWRVAAMVDAVAQGRAPKRPFAQALAHASDLVRGAAWLTAMWSGQVRALPALRQRAEEGDVVALRWLAVVGTPDDLALLERAVAGLGDAAAGCSLLARHGHPAVLGKLLRCMAEDDVVLAAAAGEAYTRMIGVELRGERRRAPVPADADDFDREMAPDLWLPDLARAKADSERKAPVYAAGTRWCRGFDLGSEVPRELLTRLDFEARWDAGVRAALAGTPVSAPPPIESGNDS